MTLDSVAPLIVSALIGYLLGSIPSGYIAVRLATGQDIRTIGSGRTGGTNVYRAAGRAAFFGTIIGDIAKGAAAVLATRALFGSLATPLLGVTAGEVLPLVAGFFALVGNNWSLFLGLRGGAGMMTSTGTMLAIAPVPVILFGLGPLLLVRLTRIASVGSLVAAVLSPFWFAAVAYFGFTPWSTVVYVLALGALLIAVHLPNIERLRRGTERRIGEPAKKK